MVTSKNLISTQTVLPIAVVTTFGFLVSYVLLGLLGITVSGESEEAIGHASRWCERVSDSIFREPVNALSNLGFIVSGLLMVVVLSRDSQKNYRLNQFHGLTPLAILYAGATIFLGPGSMLMHGTHTSWGGWADNLSMVMYILIPWLINIKEMGQWTLRRFFTIYIIIVLVYAIVRWFFGSRLGINLDMFGLSIGLWVISEILFRFWSQKFRFISGFIGFGVAAVFGIMPSEIFSDIGKYWWVILFWIPCILSTSAPTKKRNYNWFLAGMTTYLLAFVIWLQGNPNSPYCNPDSLIQLHGIWHLMTAFSTWCFFKFLRSERNLTI